MGFQQLVSCIPLVENICMYTTSYCYTPTESQAILVVKQGHVTITSSEHSSVICTEAFALNSKDGPFHIHIPKTRSAAFVLLTYRLYPENHQWSLSGNLSAMSEEKIEYMLDELLRTRTSKKTNNEKKGEVGQIIKERIMLERLLYIYLSESSMKRDMKPTISLVEETISYMNQHYMLDINLSVLAKRAGLSVGHYTVVFKNHTGTTVNAYLINLRIEKAKEMLVQSDLTAKEIGKRAGFTDYFHFSRSFKKKVGCSPKNFRNQEKGI